jgi:AAA15 family ATPase/GTPase
MGPFLHTLANGSILVVDELEARLHPHLTKALVRLFNSSANRRNAQIIFATHDVGLLDPSAIRRDELWFAEKNDRGASTLYPLTDFSVRKEGKFQREYLLGQFGAVPHVGDFRETLLHGER